MPSITRRRTAHAGRPSSAEADILDATRRLLLDGAHFTELGIQQIATEAGVARSTFYIHFRDKVDLLLRLGDEFLSASFEVSSSWQPSDGVDALAEVFLRVLTIYRQHTAVRTALTEVAAYDETVRDAWSEDLAQFTDRTLELLRAEQDAGRVDGAVDAVNATRVIVAGGERALADHALAAEPEADESFARELAAIWWYGVYRRTAKDG